MKWFLLVLVIVNLSVLAQRYSETRLASVSKKIVLASAPAAKYIYENRQPGETCKELNMNLYVWLRKHGYHPDVQIGTKNGEGHLWLELNGLIFDATEPRYYGHSVDDLRGVYKLSALESEQ